MKCHHTFTAMLVFLTSTPPLLVQGYTLTQGNVTLQIGQNSGVFGADSVILGDNTNPSTANANLTLTPTQAMASVSTPGNLVAGGGMNTARLTFNDTANTGLSATFGGIVQTPGGTLTLRANRAAERLFLTNPPQGILPPWFVIGDSGASYATYDLTEGVVRATPALTDFAASTPDDVVLVPGPGFTVLQGDSYAKAIEQRQSLNLNGHTLYLGGSDGTAGILQGRDARMSIYEQGGSGGKVDYGANTLYVYLEQNQSIQVPFRGTGPIYKFGASNLYFDYDELPGGNLVAQEGGFVIRPPGAPVTYSGTLAGASGTAVYKQGTNLLTIANSARPLDLNMLRVVGTGEPAKVGLSSPMRIIGGESFIQTLSCYRNAQLTLESGATLTVRNGITLNGDGYHNAFKLIGSTMNVSGNLTVQDSRNSSVLFDGSTVTASGGQLRLGTGGAHSNHFEIANGSSVILNNANGVNGDVEVAPDNSTSSKDNVLTIRNASLNCQSMIVGRYGTSNQVWIVDGAVVTNRNCLYIGHDGAGANFNAVFVSNACFRAQGSTGLRMGQSGNWGLLKAMDGGVIELTGTGASDVGYSNGDSNVLHVAKASAFSMAGSLTIGRTAATIGNKLLLAGGRFNAGSLTVNTGNILAIELQEKGAFETAVIAGKATFNPGTILQLNADKNAEPGVHAVLTATGGIIGAVSSSEPDNITMDAPHNQRERWKYFVENNTLFVKYLPPRSLFFLR